MGTPVVDGRRDGIRARRVAVPGPKSPLSRDAASYGKRPPNVDVAKPVDAADFNWSARGEIRGVEPLKVGER
jgi:hypothetical protein